jgi:hypothetical protein
MRKTLCQTFAMSIPGSCAFHPLVDRVQTQGSWLAKSHCESSDGVLVLYNGVTRATRIAKLSAGAFIRVEVVGKLPRPFARDPKIGDLLP